MSEFGIFAWHMRK